MSEKTLLVPGMARNIFFNGENSKLILGVGKLIEFKGTSLYYTIKETSENKTKRYVDEKWKIEFLTLTEIGKNKIHKEHPLVFKFRVLI